VDLAFGALIDPELEQRELFRCENQAHCLLSRGGMMSSEST